MNIIENYSKDPIFFGIDFIFNHEYRINYNWHKRFLLKNENLFEKLKMITLFRIQQFFLTVSTISVLRYFTRTYKHVWIVKYMLLDNYIHRATLSEIKSFCFICFTSFADQQNFLAVSCTCTRIISACKHNPAGFRNRNLKFKKKNRGYLGGTSRGVTDRRFN